MDEEQLRSWDKHLSDLREKGWAQSRQETTPLEVVASNSATPDEQANPGTRVPRDGSFHNPPPRPDTLDVVFETIEEYVCGNESKSAGEIDWDRYYADRGHINESKSEVWSLHKLGEVPKRGSVADRIKALEANSAPTSPVRAAASQAEPRSTSPVRRWRKPTDGTSAGSPRSWQRAQMEKSPRTPDYMQRPQMESKSPGSPKSDSWSMGPQMERSPASLPSWMNAVEKEPKTPQSDVARPSDKVPVPPRNANSSHGTTKSEKKQPIPAFPTKLKNIPRKPSRQDSIVARILKDSETESSGLSFVSYFEKEGIYVSKIRDTSKFKNTDLKRGMRVLRINGVRCPGRVKNVIKMLKSSKRVIEIEAMEDDSIEFVGREKQGSEETKAEKNNGSHVEPRRSRSPSKRERQDHEESPAGNENAENEDIGFTDKLMLSMGYVPQKDEKKEKEEIKPIEPIERKDSSASIASLDRSEIPEQPKNKKVHAMVFKKTRRDKIGISFVSFKKKRGVYVYEMYEDSKFQRTGLKVGMKVLAINRQPCPERVSETLALVKDIEGQLIITAVAPSEEHTSTVQGGTDLKPKIQTLNKLGNLKLRKHREKYRDVLEPEGTEAGILNGRERREILEEHSWMDDDHGDRQVTSSFSQDTHTTSSTAEAADDNGSCWGSVFSS